MTFEIITSKENWTRSMQAMDHYDFYHTFDYHALSKKKNEKAILIKYTCGEVVICLPLLLRQVFDTPYYDATSVYGYAGPFQQHVPVNFDNTEFKNLLNNFLNKSNIIAVFSRLNPFLFKQSEILKGIGVTKELSKVVNIDLTLSLDKQRSHFSKSTKQHLNKTNKRCYVVSSKEKNDVLAFYQLYHENMDRVNAKASYYFDEAYFFKFMDSENFDVEILLAKLKDTHEIIAAAMMVKTKNIIQFHISGTKTDYLNLSPIRLLINDMRIRATSENYKYFNLGGGLGNTEDSLFHFKSSFSKDFKPFKIWKYIVNEKVYQELSEKHEVHGNVDYFPLYRYTQVIINFLLFDFFL